MGQSVAALMYGISSKTRGLANDEGEGFWEDSSPGVPKSKHYPYLKAPRFAYEGGVLGFPVACSSGMDPGEGDLGKTTPLAAVERAHAKQIAQARKKWDAFAAWAEREHGKKLPAPELWLTTDERA